MGDMILPHGEVVPPALLEGVDEGPYHPRMHMLRLGPLNDIPSDMHVDIWTEPAGPFRPVQE